MALVLESVLGVDDEGPGPVLEAGRDRMLREQDLERGHEQLAQKERVLAVVYPELAAVAQCGALQLDLVPCGMAQPLVALEGAEQAAPPGQEDPREQAHAGFELYHADREVVGLPAPAPPVPLLHLEGVVAEIAAATA